MKKILFSAYSLGLGGIETALVTLLKELSSKYEITLVLEKKEGMFLSELPESIKIIEYTPNNCKNIFIRKSINFLKQVVFYVKHHNKYSFACSFATYSQVGSYCARTASKNNLLWVHNDYLTMYKGNKKEFYDFFDSVNYDKFKRISFVSNEAKENFKKTIPDIKSELQACNNLINYQNILIKAEEIIDLKKPNVTTFLNVGRHDEHQKRLTRLIEAAKILKEQDYQFKIIMLGSGQDTEYYKNLILEYNLDKHIEMLGAKKNPYPYFKMCDSIILTSDYEGYPVVFVESQILKTPILTTDVSDAKKDIDGKYGIVMEKESSHIASNMANFIKNGYVIKEEFNPEQFNKEIINQMINNIEN